MANFDPSKIVVKSNLILPVLKMEVNEPIYFKATGAIFVGKEIKGDKAGDKPADLLNCINLLTGEESQIVCGEVLKSTLQESFEGDTYVGKSFMAEKLPKPDGKRYHQYRIAEIEA